MHCTADVSKETEQSHDEESSLQGSLSHRAFWEEQVQKNNSLEANTRLHSVSKPIKRSNAANDKKADTAHRVGTTP